MKHKGIDWDNQPLGKMYDGTLAAALGVSTSTVRAARTVRKIAPFNDGVSPTTTGIKWDDEPLGVETDYAIAKRLHVATSAVHAARKRRGIAAAQPRYGTAAAVP